MSESAKAEPSIWVLADPLAGNRSQCLGVADALGLPYKVKTLSYNILARLPNAILGAGFMSLVPDARDGMKAPWPDLVIAAGRRTAPIARAIKKVNGRRTRLVQIMDPGAFGAAAFDLIAKPNHDGPDDRANVMRVTGAPHGLTAAKLEAARTQWAPIFKDLPRPLIALLVGGDTRRRAFTPAMARELGRRVNKIAEDIDGALLITTSRRSGKPATEALLAEITQPWHVHRWGDPGENPYLGYIASADFIVVTGESVSMCSEACATDKPVAIFAPAELITEKHARLHAELYAKNHAQRLGETFPTGTHEPLNAATEIAAAIRARLLA